MKVLWCTSIQLPMMRRKHGMSPLSGGSWMEALRGALEIHAPEIELGIASGGESINEPFHEGNATYFTVPVKPLRSRVVNIFNNWQSDIRTSWDISSLLPIIFHFKPDIIHIHGTENHFGLVADQVSMPVLISLQGFLTQCLPYQLSGLHWSELSKAFFNMEFLKGRGLFHSTWSMRPKAIRELAIMSLCRHFVGRTEWDKAFTKLTSPSATYHHCDELLRPEFQGSTWEQKDSVPGLIFTILNCEPRKGLLLLLDSMSLLQKSGYKHMKFRIAGNIVDTPIWPIVKKRLATNKLSQDTIEWLGPQTADQIIAELIHASVFVHPSAVDNSPNSLCEAMMVGTPCIASYV